MLRLVLPPDERQGEQVGAGAAQAARRRVPGEHTDDSKRAAEPATVYGEQFGARRPRLYLEDAALEPRGRGFARHPSAQDALHEPQPQLLSAAGVSLLSYFLAFLRAFLLTY